MKFIMSLIAVATLSFFSSAFAQEESPSGSPEEKPSANIESEPPAPTPMETATPMPTERPTPAPEKTPAAAAEKSASPAASPAKSAKAAASPAASVPPPSGRKMGVEATLKEMENRWEAAYAAHDSKVVEEMVANDFVGVSPKFKFTGRSSLLADFKRDKDTYQSTKNESLRVQSFGPNVAVVTGRAREKGAGKDGKAFDRTYYFTDTWMLRGGKWQCIASQASEMKK